MSLPNIFYVLYGIQELDGLDDVKTFGGPGDTIKMSYTLNGEFLNFVNDPLYKYYVVQKVELFNDKPEYSIPLIYEFNSNGFKLWTDYDEFLFNYFE